jgi:hypothetical protein
MENDCSNGRLPAALEKASQPLGGMTSSSGRSCVSKTC